MSGRKVNSVHFGLVGLAGVAEDLRYALVPSTIASPFSFIAGLFVFRRRGGSFAIVRPAANPQASRAIVINHHQQRRGGRGPLWGSGNDNALIVFYDTKDPDKLGLVPRRKTSSKDRSPEIQESDGGH